MTWPCVVARPGRHRASVVASSPGRSVTLPSGTFLKDVFELGDDQGVARRFMIEQVEPAFLGHQPSHEVQVGFVVLHGQRAWRCVADAELEADAVFAQDGLHDLFGGFVLEDAAVLGLRQEPEGGDDFQAIAEHVSGQRPGRCELAYQPVDVPRRKIHQSHRQADRLI